MPRRPRIDRVGACYHVTSRGLERRTVFVDERAHEHFVELLGETVSACQWRLHAYVLMGNHYHLLLHTSEANLSAGMKWLGQSFSSWFNRREKRVGPLWQGRFKADLVDWQEAGLEVSRYVHLNPVRVARLGLGKVQRARQQAALHEAPSEAEVTQRLAVLRGARWSSYRAYAGLWEGPPWLERTGTLELMARGRPQLVGDEAGLAREYVAWVENTLREGGLESPWERLKHQLVLGGKAFVEEAMGWLRGDGRRVAGVREAARREKAQWGEIVRAVEKAKGRRWAEFAERRGDEGRDVALWLARRYTRLTQQRLGELNGIGGTTVSAAQQRVREQLKAKSPVVVRCLEAAEAALLASQEAENGLSLGEKAERSLP